MRNIYFKKHLILIIVCFLALIIPIISNACETKSTTDVITDIRKWVIKTRGLEQKSDIPVEFITSDQLKDKMMQNFNDDLPAAEATTTQEILVLMDLMQPGQDLRTILLDLYSEQIAGYYDTVEKKLYVLNNEPTLSVSARVTLAHEITHALQDQHFDLKSLQDSAKDDSEKSLAIQCLTEGDASLVQSLYIYTQLSAKERDLLFEEYEKSSSSKLDAAPKYIQEDLVFPYLKGAEFVAELYKQNYSFKAIDAAYNALPVSTEQILHPAKYPLEKPVTVSIPDFQVILGSDWEKKDSGTIGERDLAYTLETYIDTATAENATIGWGGDSYIYYKNSSDAKVLIINIQWDSSSDSTEFYNAYYSFCNEKYFSNNGTPAVINRGYFWQDNGTNTALLKNGSNITVIVSTDKATADLVITAFR